MKIVIVGGGLLGLLSARELAMAGHRVTLFEQGSLGRESSWAGGGILSPLYAWEYAEPINDLAKWSQRHYPTLVDELQTEGGIDPQWTRSGLLILDGEKFARARSWAEAYGLGYEAWDPRQLRQVEPELALMAQGGLVFPEIAQVRNPRFLKSVIHSCRHYGVQLVEDSPVLGLLERDSVVNGVRLAEGDERADRVVICAGAWTGKVLAEGGINLPIRPVRGQMLLYRATPGWIEHIILYQGRYIIPRRDGRILVGSTMEEVGFDQQTTAEAKKAIGEFAERCLPGIHQFELERHWSGLRPGSPEGIPYICEVPGRKGLFLNAGHFRNGVILGPASARLLADLVLERSPILNPANYQCLQGKQILSKLL